MYYLISYDISSNPKRVRLAKCLRRAACKRLQKSVFLSPNLTPVRMERLYRILYRLVHSNLDMTDSLLCIPINEGQIEQCLQTGSGLELRELVKIPTVMFF